MQVTVLLAGRGHNGAIPSSQWRRLPSGIREGLSKDSGSHGEREDAFRNQVFTVQEAVVEALKQQWKERDDFEVGWDFDYCRHACGGIYSEAAFSKAYVQVVTDALHKVDSKGVWTYHTVCEILVNPKGKTAGECVEDRGQFFIRGGVCYIEDSMAAHHRRCLGCET